MLFFVIFWRKQEMWRQNVEKPLRGDFLDPRCMHDHASRDLISVGKYQNYIKLSNFKGLKMTIFLTHKKFCMKD